MYSYSMPGKQIVLKIYILFQDPEVLKKAFKTLCATMNVKIQEDVQSQLAMSTISPRLAALKNTLLPVPGQNRTTVAAVASTVTLLPTKSKPKKFALIGDDGVRYTFLFKGEPTRGGRKSVKFSDHSGVRRCHRNARLAGSPLINALFIGEIRLDQRSGHQPLGYTVDDCTCPICRVGIF